MNLTSIKPDALAGVFPALVTPFRPRSQALDDEALRQLMRHLLPRVDGVVTSGSTGEFCYLSREERLRVLQVALEEADGKPVIAGCGAASTREALTLTQDAQRAGAAAALIVLPYFLHPSDKGIYQHYATIAAAVDLPIILYNIPPLVDRELPRNVIEDLADWPNIIGLKDSSGQLAYMLEILEFAGDRIAVLCGHDEIVLPALAAGASGLILGSAQVYPDAWQDILRLVRAGDLDAARRRQRELQKLSRIFCRHGGPVAVKAALKMLGLNAGPPRAPLRSVGGALLHETRAEIQLELEKHGLLEAAPTAVTWPTGPLQERFGDLDISPALIDGQGLRIGSGSAGTGAERAQIDLVAGSRDSALGQAYARQLTYPLPGREALTTILEPGLTVRPSTLLLPTLPQHGLRQANMIYGPTQSALAQAIVDALAEGRLPPDAASNELMIACVTVDPRALDRHALARHVHTATAAAIDQAFGG